MLVRSVIALALAGLGSVAHADELSLFERPRMLRESAEPFLTMPAISQPHVIGLGVGQDTQHTSLMLGSHARFSATRSTYRAYDDAAPRDATLDLDLDIAARGESFGLALAYDAGFLRFDAQWSHTTLSSRYGSGAYHEVSLRISKTHRFSRWVLGWISLSIGARAWTDEPPLGEDNAVQVTLSIGATFR